MVVIQQFINWGYGLIEQVAGYSSFVTYPLFTLGDTQFTLLGILSLSGLLTFLTLAVAKWIIS